MSARDWRWRHGKRWDVGSCPLPPTKCRWFGATRRGAGRIHRTLGFLSLIRIFAWSFDPWFVGRFCFSFLSGASLAEFKTGSLTLRLEPSLNSLRNRIISCFMRIYWCAGDCKRLQVTASDCKWLQVIASDCKCAEIHSGLSIIRLWKHVFKHFAQDMFVFERLTWLGWPWQPFSNELFLRATPNLRQEQLSLQALSDEHFGRIVWAIQDCAKTVGSSNKL